MSKYGNEINGTEHLVGDPTKPTRVVIVDHRNAMWVDVRKMYTDRNSGELKHGKGVRFEIESAEEVVEAIQQAVLTSLGG